MGTEPIQFYAHKAARRLSLRAAFAGTTHGEDRASKEPQLFLRGLPNSHRRGLLFSSDAPGKTRKACAPHKLRNENWKNLRAALKQEKRTFQGCILPTDDGTCSEVFSLRKTFSAEILTYRREK